MQELGQATSKDCLLSSFLSSDSGATAFEYTLIAAVLGVGLVVALTSARAGVAGTFGEVATAIQNANVG